MTSDSTRAERVTDAVEASATRSHERFTIAILVIPAFLLMISVLLSSSPFYANHSSYPYDTVIKEKLALRGVDADLLLIGDSALLCGVKPNVMQELESEKGYNLGVPLNSFAAEKDLLIDRYLAYNNKPREIVLYSSFQLTVSNFDPDKFHAYETGFTLVNAGNPFQALRFFIKNPRRLALYGTIVLRNLFQPPPLSESVHERTVKSLRANNGFVACPEHGQRPKEQSPFIERVSTDRPDVKYFEHLKKKYQALGIKVIVVLAPLPSCLPETKSLRHSFVPAVDIDMGELPCEDFSGASNTHILPEIVDENSRKLAKLVAPFVKAGVGAGGNE